MTTITVVDGGRDVKISQVMPAAQASTDAAAVVTGSDLDMRAWASIAYTIQVADNSVTWWVYGANEDDFSDEVIVDGPSNVAAAAVDSYAVEQAPYAYYRVKIQSTVPGDHGTATVVGIAKG